MINNLAIVNNGVDIDFDTIGNLQGFEYPEISNITVKVPGRSGAFYVSSDYERRRLSWEGVVKGASARQTLASILIGSLKTLKFGTCDGLSLQTDVELNRMVMPAKQDQGKYMFDVTAPDYRLVAQALSTDSTQITVLTGGTAIPTIVPISFTSTGGTPPLTVTNNGTVNASPIFTILGPGTDFIVQNQTTGELFNIGLTLLAGETIVINIQERTIIKGSTNQYGDFSGDFWELAPGDNEIFFNATTGSTVATLLTVNYRDSYLGV